MNSKIMTVTPVLAQEWLKKNIARNRTVRSVDVARYARDMKDGKWMLNPQGIIFNTSDKLIDGQHRLYAIVQAGVPVDMVVWFDVPDDLIWIVDSGVSRTMPDHLGFMTDDPIFRNKTVISVIDKLVKYSRNIPVSTRFSPEEMYYLIARYYNIAQYVYRLMNRHHGCVIHSGYFMGVLSAIANGVEIMKVEAFDAMVCDCTIISGVFNYRAAQNFRLWYESNERPSRGGSVEAVMGYATQCIYCFVNNKKKTKSSHYPMDSDLLNALNDMLQTSSENE